MSWISKGRAHRRSEASDVSYASFDAQVDGTASAPSHAIASAPIPETSAPIDTQTFDALLPVPMAPVPRPALGAGSSPFRPDAVADGWCDGAFTVLAASVRGHSHRDAGITRQDDMAVCYLVDRRRLIVAVADGVSASEHSHVGAATAVRYAVSLLETSWRDTPLDQIDWRDIAERTAWAVKDAADRFAGPDVSLVDATGLVGTTLSVAAIDASPDGALHGRGVAIGDSSLALFANGRVEYLAGGKSADPSGYASSAVNPLPLLVAEPVPVSFDVVGDECFLIGTDGIWDPLGNGGGAISQALDTVLRGPTPSATAFANTIDFVKESFDDDRTLICVGRGRS